MKIDRFTKNAILTCQKAEKIASDNKNPVINVEHILLALLEIDESIIKSILMKILNINDFLYELKSIVDSNPKVIGSSLTISQSANDILVSTEEESKKWVIHIFLLNIYFCEYLILKMINSKNYLINLILQEMFF